MKEEQEEEEGRKGTRGPSLQNQDPTPQDGWKNKTLFSYAPLRRSRAQRRFMRTRGAASAICLAASFGTSSKF
eukprot:8172906-Pyramimonas_sp.AAC.1